MHASLNSYFYSDVMVSCGQFGPELVLVSAGFDSAVGDPLV